MCMYTAKTKTAFKFKFRSTSMVRSPSQCHKKKHPVHPEGPLSSCRGNTGLNKTFVDQAMKSETHNRKKIERDCDASKHPHLD